MRREKNVDNQLVRTALWCSDNNVISDVGVGSALTIAGPEGQQALEISVFSWQGLAQSKQQHNFGLGDLTKNVELSEPNLEH